MKKPEKFDSFIYRLYKEASRFSLVEIMAEQGITEDELYSCQDWLYRLSQIDTLPDEEESK